MTTKKNNIVLVPTDFTPMADFAIDHAAGIAKQLCGKITLLHVINKETKAYLKKEKLTDAAINEKLKIIAADVEKKYKVKLTYIAEEGSIFTTIAEVSADIGASKIVMGIHGKTGLQHLVGSYALKVIESSSIPVIVVRDRFFGKGYKKIVLPVDESPETKQKVQWAIHIAKRFDATIHLFGIKHSDEFLMNDVKRNLAQIKKFLNESNVKMKEKISADKHSNYGKSIMLYADYINADLVVIMTNPDQLLPNFLLSQWAEQVIFNSSKIPVMCINPVEFHSPYYDY